MAHDVPCFWFTMRYGIPGPQNAQNNGPYTAHTRSFWDIGPLFWAPLEVQVKPKKERLKVYSSQVNSSQAASSQPAPPNYPLRYPEYHLIETVRLFMEVHWGV